MNRDITDIPPPHSGPFYFFNKVDLGQKSIEDKIKQKRKQLSAEIRELCKEFDLRTGYHHISDLLRKLESDEH